MSAWKEEPEGDGYYWLRRGTAFKSPLIVEVKGSMVWGHVSRSLDFYKQPVNGTRWQWQKVKPCEP